MDQGTWTLLWGAFFYLIPALIALTREHHNRSAIIVLNLVFGWTLIGWAVALVWSFTRVDRKNNQRPDTLRRPF